VTVSSGSTSRSLLHHADFVKIWSAATVSLFGSQVSIIAIPAIAILTLGVSTFEASLLFFFEMLPFILFTLPAGVWVDRLRRRPILIAGDLGRALALATIPIAYAFGALTVWQLYAVGFTTGILTVFFDVADQSYLPSLVDADQLVEGNSKLQISMSAAQITGQGIGGAIIGLVTAPFAVLVDALSFLASAALIFAIRKPENPPERRREADTVARPGMRREIAEGLRYVLGNRYLRSIAACTGSSNFFSSLVFAVFFVYAYRVLGLSPLTLGIVFGIGNIGFLIGSFAAGRIPRWLGVGRTIVLSALLGGLAVVPIALAPVSELAIPFLVVSQLAAGFGQVVYNVNQVSLRQAITPERIQGRMNATMRFIVWGTMPIGTIAGGLLGTYPGLHETIWIGAIGGLFAFLPPLLSPVWRLREIPAGPEAIGALGLAGDMAPNVAAEASLAVETEAERETER
jgi:MFS family permease